MELKDGLRTVLGNHFAWNKPRLECFTGLLLSLIRLKQVNLTQLALGLGGSATLPSRYRRLQRFFQTVRFDYDALARLIVQLFDLSTAEYYLTLDRTNWK